MNRLAAVGLAAVIGGAVGAASMTAASATTVPLTADFGVVLPGATAEASTDVSVSVPSVVTEATWLERTGAGVWDARLCSMTVCTPLEVLTGESVPAGEYRVVISVTMPMDAAASGRTTAQDRTTAQNLTTAQGRISLMESIELPLTDGETLAATGGSTAWTAAIVGAAAVGGGALLLLRRRRTDEDTR